ncbi:MAG: tetratricopeptide repeat protein [candidate division Zixibacteria bacterium]|nr:tetratricopeptide repeat protein [candidate division Zixibacteria bacterium]
MIQRTLVAAFILCFFWNTQKGSCYDSPVDSSQIYMEKASRSFKPEVQESLYRAAIRVKPDCGECYFKLGKLFLSQERYDKAISEFYFAAEYNPGLEGLHYYLGTAFEMSNDFQNALTEYKLAVHDIQDSAHTKALSHLAIGSIFDAVAIPESAGFHFRKAIEHDSTNQVAYFNLGITYDDRGMYKEAIACYKRAAQLDSTDVDALINLGVSYCQVEEYDLAVDVFHRGLDKDPQNFKLHFNLANAYLLARENELARKQFEHTIKLDSSRSESYYHLARIYEEMGDLEAAKKNYSKFVELASPKYEITIREVREQIQRLQQR